MKFLKKLNMTHLCVGFVVLFALYLLTNGFNVGIFEGLTADQQKAVDQKMLSTINKTTKEFQQQDVDYTKYLAKSIIILPLLNEGKLFAKYDMDMSLVLMKKALTQSDYDDLNKSITKYKNMDFLIKYVNNIKNGGGSSQQSSQQSSPQQQQSQSHQQQQQDTGYHLDVSSYL